MSESLKIPQSLLNEQLAASNPVQSAWVSANAGSGKTHVLTQRVIRLMLEGNPPDRILCLTFTKAAAANMKIRVFEILSAWTMMDGAKLSTEIQKATGSSPTRKTLNRARQLFAEALDTPGGLKIQTIHAFSESLLHQFPLEANISGHFEVMHDITRDALLANAQAKLFSTDKNTGVLSAYERLAPQASDPTINSAVSEIIRNRHEFRLWLDKHGTVGAAVDELYSILGVGKEDTPESIQKHFLVRIASQDELLKSVAEVAGLTGKKTDQDFSHAIANYTSDNSTFQCFQVLSDLLLTKNGTPKSESKLVTKTVRDEFPDLVNVLLEIAHELLIARQKITSLKLIEISESLFLIADGVLENYEREKRARGLVDYDDLIRKCVTLFEREDIRDWIRYRLDQGIDHLLVDEAQDTSPAQWQIINAITEDFHVGEGAARRERTVFVVGDEKQSIYSFQGADPKEFERQRLALKKAVSTIGKQLKNARLDLSFRSTKDVLHAVDHVFGVQENVKGLTQSGDMSPHDAVRQADPGEVQVWPLFGKSLAAEPDNWLDPVDREGSGDPAALLAKRITETIGNWVGKPLPGTGKPLAFGDILVLVRKRDRFITALTRTMKDAGLAVAGADRLYLLEHIAVEDLISAGKFALLPDDDLNLACFLKSIFFDVSDAELFHLTHARESRSLNEEVVFAARSPEHPGHVTAKRVLPSLEHVRSAGKTYGPFGFYTWLLGAQGGRRKILSRLGMEAEDVLDAFIDEITDFVRDGGTSLETFLSRLTTANPEIKRELELDRDEVRILTVHASKGLEARVVFLVDSCGKAWISNHRPKVMQLGDSQQAGPFLWVPTTADQVEETIRKTSEIEAAAEGEYRRLLYVGMTRAADRLVVCGYHGDRPPNYPHWHKMISDALGPTGNPILGENNEEIGFRWVSEDRPPLPAMQPSDKQSTEQKTRDAPDWLFTAAPADPPLPRPLTPSGAFALIDEDFKENRKPAFESLRSESPYALEVGKTVHRLLEILPGLASTERLSYANRYIDHSTVSWPESLRVEVMQSVQRVLGESSFDSLFSPNSRAEVNVIGSIETKSGLKLISGQIDRLIVEDTQVQIIDYKTNRNVPESGEDAPPEYITQLALYRHLVSQMYPNHRIRCKLLWTSEAKLVELPSELMDRAIAAVNNG